MLFALIAVIIVVIVAFSMFRQNPATEAEPAKLASTPASETTNMLGAKSLPKPEITLDTTKVYQAVLHTTEGDIVIDLNVKNTPVTANNFVYLARNNFYDNTIFHRVIDGFMIQGGDPTGTGTGGPGYKFDDESVTGEYTRGAVAMANSGQNTNGSQFFIMHATYPLPKNYVIFGQVSMGLEVVDKIATAETTISLGGEKSKPVNPASITSIEILE